MNTTLQSLLHTVSGLFGKPNGAYNFRVNGMSAGYASTDTVTITPKEKGAGISVLVAAGTVGETVHIPVVIDQGGIVESVENDFIIGENCDITIVAGCGIHNDSPHLSQHDGIHTFRVGRGAKVRYTEKHYGNGQGGKRVLNPVTKIYLADSSSLTMETIQIEGVDSTNRQTFAEILDNASLVINEKLMTSGQQYARTDFSVSLDGSGASVDLCSLSVAKDNSQQEFISRIVGNNLCAGHSECDAIIMDNGMVTAIPEVRANHVDASLIHEAAIGKIAGEQIMKLLTLGLDREEAEAEIIHGFLR